MEGIVFARGCLHRVVCVKQVGSKGEKEDRRCKGGRRGP